MLKKNPQNLGHSRKFILAKNVIKGHSRKFIPKISRFFSLAKVSFAKDSFFKVILISVHLCFNI